MYTRPIKNEYLENRLNRTETALSIGYAKRDVGMDK